MGTTPKIGYTWSTKYKMPMEATGNIFTLHIINGARSKNEESLKKFLLFFQFTD